MRRTGKAIGILAAASALSVFGGGLAIADNAVADGDGDGVAPVGDNEFVGEACAPGQGVHQSRYIIPLAVKRNGSAGSTNVFKDGSTVTFSRFSGPTPAVVGLPSPATVTLPSGWSSQGNNTLSSALSSTLTLDTTGTAAGDTVIGAIVYRARGLNSANNTIDRDDTMTVTAPVVNGATATSQDCVVPTASITNPASAANYGENSSQNVDFSCEDVAGAGGAAASGVKNCDATVTKPDNTSVAVTDGGSLPTAAVGAYTVTVSAEDNAGNTATASRGYTVTASNNPPTVTVQGVTHGAIYNKGQVPAAICAASDAEDGPSAPTAVLSAITGTYASDGIGSQTATCDYTDEGGLSAQTATATYSIVDPSAPSIDYDLTPEQPNGSNGWYKSGNVALDWTVSEPESPNSLNVSGCVDQNVTVDQAATTYSCAASSAGGSADQVDVTIKRDATRPALTGTPQGTPTNGWYTDDVTVAWTGDDNLSGVDEDTLPDDSIVTGEGSNLSTGAVTVFDLAGNESLPTTKSGIKIDRTAPTSSVSGVAANAVYATPPTVTCSATDQTGLSGVASHGTVTGNTTTAGLKSVSCNGATDNAGNTQTVASASVSYTLAPAGGFNSNFDSTTNVLKVKPNQAIPLKWAFSDGTSNFALLGSAATLSSVSSNRCTVANSIDGSEPAAEVAAGASGLQLLPDISYQMNWKATSTTGCRALTLTAPYATGGGSFTRTILVNIVK